MNKKYIKGDSMVEYKKRFIDETVMLEFKDLPKLQSELLAGRLKLEDTNEFCNMDNPLAEFLKDSKLKDAALLLRKHIDANSSILVITDGDCDGISCAAVANLFFRHEVGRTPREVTDTDMKDTYTITPYEDGGMSKGELRIIVNDREFGNGVNLVHAKDILKHKPDLIITADHGSADNKSFQLIKDILPFTEILVTDHHIVPDGNIPICDAFVNPQDVTSTLGKALCGASVLYMLFRAYNGKEMSYLYPILGLATVVDQMSLNIGYNRYFYKQANKYLRHFKPFREYTKYVKHRYLWSTEFYSIGLGPLINSTKRMNVPEVGYRFLTSETEDDIFKNYKAMVDTNKKRKNQQVRVEESIAPSLEKDRSLYKSSRVAISPIKNGVNGILASRLVEDDHVPAFVFNHSGNTLEGSGRGHADFDIEGLISKFRTAYEHVYISGGGHKGAGGLRLKTDGMYLFRDMFERQASKSSSVPVEYYDMELPIGLTGSKLTRKLLRELQPFGRGFEYPVFKTKGYIVGYKNYGPSFFIYTIRGVDGLLYNMMRFSKLDKEDSTMLYDIYLSPRGKKDFILLSVL